MSLSILYVATSYPRRQRGSQSLWPVVISDPVKKMFIPRFGDCTHPPFFSILVPRAHGGPNRAKVKQGDVWGEGWGENTDSRALIAASKGELAGRASSLKPRSLQTFSPRLRVRLSIWFSAPWPPELGCTCCCSYASWQQWHLLSVAIKNLNVNIFALKWMEKYLSLSGNHSSNKRLARQGP